jgi:hypothetical protein
VNSGKPCLTRSDHQNGDEQDHKNREQVGDPLHHPEQEIQHQVAELFARAFGNALGWREKSQQQAAISRPW